MGMMLTGRACGMTLCELMVDAVGLGEPFTCLVCGLQGLRSIEQGEAATAEGCCASLEAWQEVYGEITPVNVSHWLHDLGGLADRDILDGVVLWALDEGD